MQQRHIGVSLEYDDGDSVWCPQLTGDFKMFAFSVVWVAGQHILTSSETEYFFYHTLAALFQEQWYCYVTDAS